ncbi:unnamed protein product, partial [Closterium sp. NIES-53]
RGGEFSSDLLRAFCRAEGIRLTFTLPASPQQNGIAERRIGMVMDVACTSMIHAAAPHFQWPFAVQYAVHQINLQPCVSLPETTPTLRWTGKVGEVSVFRVWGSRALVCDTSTDKLSSRAVQCVFLGFPPDAPGWQFYHPTSRHVLSSQDVTCDESVSYYHPVEPIKVAVDSGTSRGSEPASAGPGVAELERMEPGGAEPGGAESGAGSASEVGAAGGAAGAGAAGAAGPGGTGAVGGPTRIGAAGGAFGAGAAGGAFGAGAAGGAGSAGVAGATGPEGASAGGSGTVGGHAGVGAAGVGAVGNGAVTTGYAARAGAVGGTGAGSAVGVVAGDPGAKGTGLHLPSFSTNLVSTAALLDAMVTSTTPGGLSLYPLASEPPQVAASAQGSASGQVAASCLRRLLSHETLLWHHRLGHPSLPRLRGMHSQFLVSGLPMSLPPLPPSPAPPCLPCVKGRQRAAPHSPSFPLTTAPQETLHMDDLPVLRLHSDRGGEFSCNLLRDLCRGEGILQSFTLPDSPQQNGIAERRIGLVMELNLWPRVSLPETSPTLRWTGKVGDASVFRDVTFDEAVPFYRHVWIAKCHIGLVMVVALTSMIHAAAPHFLWPFALRYAAHQLNLWPCISLPETSPTLHWTGEVGNASVFRVWGSRAFVRDTSADKLSARAIPCVFLGFVPVWQFYHPTSIYPPSAYLVPPFSLVVLIRLHHPLPSTAPVEIAVGSGAARGTASGGAAFGGAEPRGAGSAGAGSGGAELGGEEPEGAEPEGVEPRGAELEVAESGGAEPRGAASSGEPAGASPQVSLQQLREWLVRRACLWSGDPGAGGAGDTGAGGAKVTAGAGGTRGTPAPGRGGARTGGTRAAGTGGFADNGVGDQREPGAAGVGRTSAGGARAGGAGVGGTGAGGAGAAGAGAVDPGDGGAGGTVRPQLYFIPLLLQVLGVPSSPGLTPPLLCPPPNQSQPPLQPASPLPSPSPYTEQSIGLTERHELVSRPVSPVRTARRVPCSCPSPVSSTHAMALRPSSVPVRVPLPTPPGSSLPQLLDFAASASASPPSVGGECALGTDVLEDRQCLAAGVPRFASILLALEGDPGAPDTLTPRSYAEAITGPYSSQWQAAMDAEMASWKSTGTYVDEFPPRGANIINGMWIFRVKRPPGSLPAFKACYIDYFQTFFPTPKMTTLRVLLHVAAQHDYELHSLDFSTAFLQGTLQEEIWLRRPPDFTGTTLAALGFAPSTADLSLFLQIDTSLPPFYVDDFVFATANTEALTLVKSELQKRHTCTDLGELHSYLGLQITRDKARRTITLTQSHMVHQVLQRFGFQFSSPQPTPLSTDHSVSAPPSDESVEPSGPYPELVGCLMYLMTCTRPDLTYPLSLVARYVAPGGHRKVHWDAAKRVLRYLCGTSSMGLVLGGWGPVVLTCHADASWVDDSATQQSSQGYTFSLGSGSVSWRSTHSSSVLSSNCEAEIYAGAMATRELRWLTYLLTYLGEQPRSPPVMYVDNKAMIALCQEHRLEHRKKHIALPYFLAWELQQRGQLCLAYVATRANTADIFTKALSPGDHQRFSTVLGLVPTLPHLLIA